MDTYIEKLQQKETEILVSVTQICDKLNLKYIIYAGTLLGAVRHQGFIPWDDDIDIVMPREDYEEFLKQCGEYLPDDLIVQNYKTENFNHIYTKIRDKNTLFLEKNSMEFNISNGIFIDVFPFDRCYDSQIGLNYEYYRRKKFNLIATCYSNNNISSIVSPFKRLVARAIKKIVCDNISMNQIMLKEDNRRKSINKKGGDCYPLDYFTKRGGAKYNELFNTVNLKFGQYEFKAPMAYDKILTQMYGDYMKLPPVEQRITHKPLKVSFDVRD